METTTTAAAALEPRQTASHRGSHAPTVGRDVHARLAGTRPNQDVDLPPFWGADGFTFDDLVDLINPLHHIPLVGSLYRSLTGDQIAAGPRIMGGALFAGGPVGAVIAAAGNTVNAGIAHDTGKDVGGHVLAWLGIDDGTDAPNPSPSGSPVEVAEISDLPWLTPEPVAAPMTQPAPQATALAPPPPAIETVAYVAPASPPPRPQPPASAPTEADQANLSDHQWAMLVASLQPQEVPRAERRPADPPRQQTPPAAPAPSNQPADIAAAMVRALDKYEALARARTLDDLAE